jgi:hypothetical protein
MWFRRRRVRGSDEVRTIGDIEQTFNELYTMVRAWSRKFSKGDNPSSSLQSHPPDLEQQIEQVIYIRPPHRLILNDIYLRQHVIEGLVGASIFRTLNQQSMYIMCIKSGSDHSEIYA